MTREYGVLRRRLLFEEDDNREDKNLRIITYTHNNNVLYDIIWGTIILETNNVILDNVNSPSPILREMARQIAGSTKPEIKNLT
jgi:hypothetical protein